jgi:hypothetical protein
MDNQLKSVAVLGLLLLLAACRTSDPRYDLPEALQSRVDSLQKDPNYTCLEYKWPRLNKNREIIASPKSNHFTFKTRHFKDGQATFALMGTSTANYGIVEKIVGTQRVRLDSTTCKRGDFLLLHVNPVAKGDYEIRAWGCRYRHTLYVHLK